MFTGKWMEREKIMLSVVTHMYNDNVVCITYTWILGFNSLITNLHSIEPQRLGKE